MASVMQFFTTILDYLRLITIADMVDIAIMAFIIYKGITLLQRTNAVAVAKALLFIFVVMWVSYQFNLNAVNFVVQNGQIKVVRALLGDVNGDGVINAQDALSTVDTWLRKGDQPTDLQILTMNVNGDGRINTYDALGIVEAFVNKTDYLVVTKAATENQ